jgi:hypothetical protein
MIGFTILFLARGQDFAVIPDYGRAKEKMTAV